MARCTYTVLLAPGIWAMAGKAQAPTVPELSTHDESTVFRSKVTLIQVPAVVRDKDGKTVDTLRRENFQLFDNGRPQVISTFSIERTGGKAIASVSAPDSEPGATVRTTGLAGSTAIAPGRFIAFLFDDIHMNFENLTATRVAAGKFVASGLTAS
jgi:VWFA-related protein